MVFWIWTTAEMLLLVDIVGTYTRCDLGWFGTDCMYRCYCMEQKCKEDGNCLPSYTCSPGWFGPACQYIDLAVTATKNSWLTDRDDSTCNPYQNSTSLSLTVDTVFSWARYVVYDSAMLHDINIRFNGGETCRTLRTFEIDEKTLDFYCTDDVPVREVELIGDGVGYLCTLYISHGRNVALRQDVVLSSIAQGVNSFASSAVDGDIGQRYPVSVCAIPDSSDNRPSLNLTFRRPHYIHGFKLYLVMGVSRASDLSPHFKLLILAHSDKVVMRYNDPSNEIDEVYAQIFSALLPVVKVRFIPKRSSMVGLCEMELYGDVLCPPQMYGLDCDEQCTFCKGQKCFSSTGSCIDGCVAGRQYSGCKKCDPGFYGIDCALSCPPGCRDSVCRGQDGLCSRGCEPGFTGSLCDQECTDGYYGDKCAKECSRFCSEAKCNVTTGDCKLQSGITDSVAVTSFISVLGSCMVILFACLALWCLPRSPSYDGEGLDEEEFTISESFRQRSEPSV